MSSSTLASPLSFSGSASRLWAMGTAPTNTAVRYALTIPLAVTLIAVAWMMVGGWYAMTCIFLPLTIVYRLFRRSGRRDAVRARQHRELMAAVANGRRAA